MDVEGNVVIPQQFAKAGIFLGDYAWVVKDGKCGYINKKGELVVPLEYDYVNSAIDGYAVCGKGITTTDEEDRVTYRGIKYGMIDMDNNVVIPFEYDNATWAPKGYMAAQKDGKWGMIDKDNKVVIPFVFDDLSSFTGTNYGGIAYGIVDRQIYSVNFIDQKYGDVNNDGQINITDVVSAAAHVKGVRPLSEEEMARADVNGDGKVNITDVSKLAAHVKNVRSLYE